MNELSYALAVLASITYGAADFLGGLATKRGSTVSSVVILSQSTGLILVVLSLPFLPKASPTAINFVWGGAAGLAGGVGLALLYRGLAIGMMSVVAPVTAVCAVIIPVAVAALGERPSLLAIMGILVAIVAIVLISQSEPMDEGKPATTGLPVAIASGIAIGIFLVCLGRTGPAAGLWPLIAARVASISLFITAGLIAKEKLTPRRESTSIVIGGGALDMAANILYLIAVRQGPLSIVATLTSLYPASAVVLARIVLRERLRLLQQAGVACAAVAIVLIVSG